MQDLKGTQAYQSILKIDPYHLSALNNLAWVTSEELGQYEDGLNYANTGVLRYPEDPNLLNTRGVILFRLGRLPQARADLEKCLALPNILPGTRARTLTFLGRITARGRSAAGPSPVPAGPGARPGLEGADFQGAHQSSKVS